MNVDGTYGKPELEYCYSTSDDDGIDGETPHIDIEAVDRRTGYNYIYGSSANKPYGFIFERDTNGSFNDRHSISNILKAMDGLFKNSEIYILSETGVSFKDMGFKNVNINK